MLRNLSNYIINNIYLYVIYNQLLEYMNISVQNKAFVLFLFIYIFYYFQTDDFIWTISYVGYVRQANL